MRLAILILLCMAIFACRTARNNSSKCQAKEELIIKNFITEQESHYIKLKSNDSEQYVAGLITAGIFFKDLDCFSGKQFHMIKEMLGKPHFRQGYNNYTIYNYYFDDTCKKPNGVCHYWEFVVNKNNKILLFFERVRNIPETGNE